MTRSTAIAGVIASLLLAAAPARAQPVVSADEFAARIARARAIAVDGSAAPSEAAMRSVVRALGIPVVVNMPWGSVTVSSAGALDELSGARAADFGRAIAHLDAMDAALREALAVDPPSRERVRDALAGAYDGVQAERSFLQRLRARAIQAVAAVIERVARATASGLGRVTAFIAAGLLLALAAWMIARRVRVVPDQVVRGHAAGAATDWRVLVSEAEARGDLEGAVRAQFKVLLAELAARGVVRDEPSLTAGECRAAVAGTLPSLYPVVADATGAFERVAYGHSPAAARHLEALRHATDAARAA